MEFPILPSDRRLQRCLNADEKIFVAHKAAGCGSEYTVLSFVLERGSPIW